MRRNAFVTTLAACAGITLRAQAPAALDSTTYTVLMASNVAGHQSVRRHGDSAWTAFEFNDRGRGPSVTQVVVIGANGVPTAMTITGHDYLKVPVSESFAVNAGTATWKNASESGSGADRQGTQAADICAHRRA